MGEERPLAPNQPSALSYLQMKFDLLTTHTKDKHAFAQMQDFMKMYFYLTLPSSLSVRV